MTPKSLKKRRVLRESSGVQSADCRTWTRGALPREFEFSYFVSLPYVVVPIKGGPHLFWLQGACPPQPGERTHTALRMRWSTAACGASRAGFPSLPPPAPSPCLTSCTPHSLRRAVWRTKNSGLPRSWPGGTKRLRRAATARARRFFSSRHPLACPRTALTAAHGPPCAAHHPSREACTPSGRARNLRGLALRVFCAVVAHTHGRTHTHTHTHASFHSSQAARQSLRRAVTGTKRAPHLFPPSSHPCTLRASLRLAMLHTPAAPPSCGACLCISDIRHSSRRAVRCTDSPSKSEAHNA